MKRTTILAIAVLIGAVCTAGIALALSGSGKVMSVEADRVVLQLAKGQGGAFPVGTRGIDIKTADGITVRGRVVSVKGDKVTFRIMRGVAASLPVGAAVKLDQPLKAGSEEMQGC